MYLLLIAGIVCIAAGIALFITGIVQCRRRITSENGYIPADAEVIAIEERLTFVTIKGIPVPAKEYSPVLRYRTESGEETVSKLPAMAGVSPELKDYRYAHENGTYIAVHYDPDKPDRCYYGSKKAFRIREAVYKFIAGALLGAIGCLLIWAHFHI